MNILDKIIQHKKEEVTKRKAQRPQIELYHQAARYDFTESLKSQDVAIIAEIKKGSPSKGIIREDFNVADITLAYEQGGASCLSVLTDESFFFGHDDNLKIARANCHLPLLRKDFIVDEYQITESQALGANAILLIAKVLDLKQLSDYMALAHELNLSALVECHDMKDLEKALNIEAPLIGINNRNLETFKTDTATSFELIKEIPKDVTAISESGLDNPQTMADLIKVGYQGFLIGEYFMRQDNVQTSLAMLTAEVKRQI